MKRETTVTELDHEWTWQPHRRGPRVRIPANKDERQDDDGLPEPVAPERDPRDDT